MVTDHPKHPQPWAIRRFVRRIARELRWLDAHLIPRHCHNCSTPLPHSDARHSLCDTCRRHCLQQPPQHCPRCAEPYASTSQQQHLCSHCLMQPPPFEWLATAGLYQGVLHDLLQQFKYHQHFRLAAPLSELILEQLQEKIETFAPQLIIPVPLHRQRLKQRGYNQAQLLAKQLGKALDCPTDERLLIRRHATQPLAQLTPKQRRSALRGAFDVSRPSAPRRILLIDDIVTTTATARACSHQLTRHGHQVAVVAVARACGEG